MIFSQLKWGSSRFGVIWDANYILFVLKLIFLLSLLCCGRETKSSHSQLSTSQTADCFWEVLQREEGFYWISLHEQGNNAGAWWKRGKKLSKPHRIWNKQVPFQDSQTKTFSYYSHSHRNPFLPWNVHIQTLSTKFSLFNLCSSKINISTTISSLSTYSKY